MPNKIFLDCNIFIDTLIDENSLKDYGNIGREVEIIKASKKCIKNYIIDGYKLAICSLTLANAFYTFTRRHKTENNEFFAKILSKFESSELYEIITDTSDLRNKAWQYAIKNGSDYEDALQYFCAKEHNCNAIITNDKDFPKLDIALIRTDPEQKNYEPK